MEKPELHIKHMYEYDYVQSAKHYYEQLVIILYLTVSESDKVRIMLQWPLRFPLIDEHVQFKC